MFFSEEKNQKTLSISVPGRWQRHAPAPALESFCAAFFKKRLFFLLCLPTPAAAATVISLGAAPPPPPGFSSLPYANPAAPQGGSLTLAAVGSFDNFNPFILQGTAPNAMYAVFQPLFKLSDTDSVTAYAELAQSVEIAPGRVTFHLNPRARFSDGVPVTAADVAWTFRTLVTQGSPFYAGYYAPVAAVATPDAATVTFTLRPGASPATALDLATMDVLPAHFWAHRDFAAPLRDPPPGSGPYRIGSVDWGRSITLARVPGWWAADLPADRGFDNFDSVTTVYYGTATAALQAFKAGLADAYLDATPPQWRDLQGFARGHDAMALEQVPRTLPAGITGYVLNTRRPALADPRTRAALALAFDFPWVAKTFLGGGIAQETSFFSNSPLAAPAGPADPAPLRHAFALLRQAGWRIENLRLVDAAGRPFRVEILCASADDERIALAYAAMLRRLGIGATIRLADPATYRARLASFDFDIAKTSFPETDFPGAEQAGYWGCAAAATPGSANLSGICSPAIDAAVAAAAAAATPAAKARTVQALDRLLRAAWIVIPFGRPATENLAWWADAVAKPDMPLQLGADTSLWWAVRR